jgi:GntR family galactonate operon transcriptional repressor
VFLSQAAGSTQPAALAGRPRRLADVVVDDLVDRIVTVSDRNGMVLPTEPELCAMYGVSRTVIREAIKALESMRLVQVLQGHGTSVRPLTDWDLLSPAVLAATIRHDTQLSILEDLIDVRCALEGQMARQAAERATPEQLAAVEQAMAQLRGATSDPTRYLDLDREFHERIMIASGNRLGRAAMLTLNEQAWRSSRYIVTPDSAECELSNVAHERILGLLLARDATATQAMTQHITESWDRRRPRARAAHVADE